MSAITSPIDTPDLRPRLDPAGAEHPATKGRSTFVTVLGWLGILKSAPAMLVMLVQMLFVGEMLADVPDVQIAMSIIFGVYAGAILISAFTLLTSVRLLQRVEWARKVMRGFLFVSAAFCILGPIAPAVAWATQPIPVPGWWGLMFPVVFLPFGAVFGYLAHALGREEIRAEFA